MNSKRTRIIVHGFGRSLWSVDQLPAQEVNHLHWELIANHNEWPKPYTVIRRFLFELVDMIYHRIEIIEKW